MAELSGLSGIKRVGADQSLTAISGQDGDPPLGLGLVDFKLKTDGRTDGRADGRTGPNRTKVPADGPGEGGPSV